MSSRGDQLNDEHGTPQGYRGQPTLAPTPANLSDDQYHEWLDKNHQELLKWQRDLEAREAALVAEGKSLRKREAELETKWGRLKNRAERIEEAEDSLRRLKKSTLGDIESVIRSGQKASKREIERTVGNAVANAFQRERLGHDGK